jgi:hypothetical protein
MCVHVGRDLSIPECKFATSAIKHLENDSHQRRNTSYLDWIFQPRHEAFISMYSFLFYN